MQVLINKRKREVIASQEILKDNKKLPCHARARGNNNNKQNETLSGPEVTNPLMKDDTITNNDNIITTNSTNYY